MQVTLCRLVFFVAAPFLASAQVHDAKTVHFRSADGTKADFEQLRKLVGEQGGSEIRVREWYPER